MSSGRVIEIVSQFAGNHTLITGIAAGLALYLVLGLFIARFTGFNGKDPGE